ncbi:MAG: type III PLP-dependent enzyme [Rhodospirillales bacterium]|nr:type III PLP-dependent enzyme [Rhodospirillales bacterium]
MTDDLFKGSREASVYAFSLPENQSFLCNTQVRHLKKDVDDAYIRKLRPAIPVSIIKPDALVDRTRRFVKAFTGQAMYAVKCNPDPILLKAMYKGGIRRFDAASISEIRLIKDLFPDAKIYFMHPIKAPEAIREAYVNHGVRAFVLDYADELDKILQETNAAPDLELFVRMAIPKEKAGGDVATDFSSKFGAKPEQAAELLRLCRPYCSKLGLSFHVGTQCHDPIVYAKALKHAADAIEESGVKINTVDIGGGFPAELTAEHPVPQIETFTQTIAAAIKENSLDQYELLCEVGRGLVACAGELVVRVEGRKDDLLYLNDGTYGGLFEAGGSIGLPYPARLIRKEPRKDTLPLKAFRFAGPTCDSVDMMRGPFMLPADVRVGDWIRLEQLGAYGEVSRTDFNGFGVVQKIVIQKSTVTEKQLETAQM